jgi:hypothetical protein
MMKRVTKIKLGTNRKLVTLALEEKKPLKLLKGIWPGRKEVWK